MPFWRELAAVLQEGCAEDEARACGELAELYAEGKGVEADDARAAKLYEKACRLSQEVCADYPRPSASPER